MSRKLDILYSVEPSQADLAARAADYIAQKAAAAVTAHGRARIAISGGSTPRAAFALLADSRQPWRAELPWDRLDLWWVDERCVPPDDADSNYRMTRDALLDRAPLQPEQIHRMRGELEPEDGAAQYEAEIKSAFGLRESETPRFDLVQLGMGPDGHTASLFPHTPALFETHRLAVANHVAAKDAWRITLTLPVINQAADVFFLIAGQDKAHILKEVVLGAKDPQRLPSQLISPQNGILTLLLDQSAAAFLPETGQGGMGTIARI